MNFEVNNSVNLVEPLRTISLFEYTFKAHILHCKTASRRSLNTNMDVEPCILKMEHKALAQGKFTSPYRWLLDPLYGI